MSGLETEATPFIACLHGDPISAQSKSSPRGQTNRVVDVLSDLHRMQSRAAAAGFAIRAGSNLGDWQAPANAASPLPGPAVFSHPARDLAAERS